jgi:Na+-transporting NADH:ubiquinone oxidoreductase subunit A
MATFKLKQGYDVRLDGAAEATLVGAPEPQTVAVKPVEFRGMVPKLCVKQGDTVKSGSPIGFNKAEEDVKFTSPISGTVKEIVRGHRRSIEAVIIEADGSDSAEEFKQYSGAEIASLSRDDVLEQLKASGLFYTFRQRPFDHIADINVTPRDIFVSAFDSAPLAPDYKEWIDTNADAFQAGLDVCSVLTGGKVHLSHSGKAKNTSDAVKNAKNVEHHSFSGKHPAGCVGVQIHHVNPIRNRKDAVWYNTVNGVIMMGKLFLTGKLDPKIQIAVTGTSATNRKYFRTTLGANIESLHGGSVKDEDIRYIAGNVLTGRQIAKDGYVGFHDNMITLIPEAPGPIFMGWMLPGMNRESSHRTYPSAFLGGKKFECNTILGGGIRALFASGIYERVLPMDIYPTYLVKSILAQDFVEMEGLGIYEITEEEIAVCDYICPSKFEFQQTLRAGLDLVYKEG